MGAADENGGAAGEPSTSYPTEGPFHLKATCKGHSKGVASVRFSPCGALLASASADATWKLWRVPDGALQDPPGAGDQQQQQQGKKQKAKDAQQQQQHSKGLNDIAWNPSSTYVATASDDLTARLWDAETQKCVSTYPGHTNYVSCCLFNPAGTILVSGSYDETVRFWDVRSSRCLRQLPVHCDPITAMSFHPDGTVLATCSFDGMLRLWDTSTGHCRRTQAIDNGENPLSNVTFSPNGRYLLLSALSSTLRLLNTKEGAVLRMYRGLTSKLYCSQATFISTLPQQQAVASGSEDGSIFVWDLNSKQVLQQIPAGKAPAAAAEDEGEEDSAAGAAAAAGGHCGPVLSVDAHPTLPLLASGGLGDDCAVRLWSADADSS